MSSSANLSSVSSGKSSRLSWPLFVHLLKETASSWSKNKAARLGAALSFYSALSIAPLLLFILTMAASLWDKSIVQDQIMSQMTSLIGAKGADAIQAILTTAGENKSAGLIASIAGFVTLIFSASGVFGELQDAMNIIWQVKPQSGKAVQELVRQRMLSFTMVVGCGFLMLVSLVVSMGLAAFSHYIKNVLPTFIILMRCVNFIVSFGVISFIFGLIFKVVPDIKIPWRSVGLGGALTACLFMIGKALIGLYLAHTGAASAYGAAGSFIVLLLWVYYSSQILFFGAEFTHAYSEYFQLHQASTLEPNVVPQKDK